MKNIKKATITLPKNIQLTFITAAAIAFVINAIYWIGLLLRVYPHGMRLSQFSIMAFSEVLLPAILFFAAYFVVKKGVPRFERIFNAVLLAIAGLALHIIVTIIERMLTEYQNIYTGVFAITWMPAVSFIVTLVAYGGLLYALYPRNKKTNDARVLQLVVLFLIIAAFIADASFNISSLILQNTDNKSITGLLTNPLLITPVVFPNAFFATAYFMITKLGGRLNRLFTATIYTLVGFMVILITTMLFNIGVWSLPLGDTAAIHALDLQTIFAASTSFIVYTFLIISHNQLKKNPKKSK
jgi:hypothetical protein